MRGPGKSRRELRPHNAPNSDFDPGHQAEIGLECAMWQKLDPRESRHPSQGNPPASTAPVAAGQHRPRATGARTGPAEPWASAAPHATVGQHRPHVAVGSGEGRPGHSRTSAAECRACVRPGDPHPTPRRNHRSPETAGTGGPPKVASRLLLRSASSWGQARRWRHLWEGCPTPRRHHRFRGETAGHELGGVVLDGFRSGFLGLADGAALQQVAERADIGPGRGFDDVG